MNDEKPKGSQTAVALKYEGRGAPRVVAKGEGHIADKIIELAKENNVPLLENKDLVQVLALVELEGEIPVALYKAVAEVLAFVYHLSDKAKEMNPLPPII